MPHINTRTYPYGTQRKGRIMELYERGRLNYAIIRDAEDHGEAYVLLDGPGAFDGFSKDQDVTIEFRLGGITRAHWKIVK